MRLLHNVPNFRLGLAEMLGKICIALHSKSGKEIERFRNIREDRCSDKRGTREKKKRTKNDED